MGSVRDSSYQNRVHFLDRLVNYSRKFSRIPWYQRFRTPMCTGGCPIECRCASFRNITHYIPCRVNPNGQNNGKNCIPYTAWWCKKRAHLNSRHNSLRLCLSLLKPLRHLDKMGFTYRVLPYALRYIYIYKSFSFS
jgi:hypothetical protein